MKEWAQIAGGVLLTLALAVYGMRLLPFVTADPDQLPRSRGRVAAKMTESLSGSARADALTYLVVIDVAEPAARIESSLSQQDYGLLSVGDPVDVVVHGRQVLARADLRWHGPHRSRFWLVLGAAVLAGAETLRRLYRQVRAGSPGKPPLPARDLR